MKIATFVDELSAFKSANVFNPYADRCPLFDRYDAPARRRANLTRILNARVKTGARSIWIARDLGYRGGRRTGIPLTDEAHLAPAEMLFGVESLSKATKGDVMAERTAAIIWDVLENISEPLMLWNVFPFHPHEAGNPMSNRRHSAHERMQTRKFLDDLVALLNPKHLVAIGRDAQAALEDINLPVICVRHPSYGGQKQFIQGVLDHYGTNGTAPRKALAPPLFA